MEIVRAMLRSKLVDFVQVFRGICDVETCDGEFLESRIEFELLCC